MNRYLCSFCQSIDLTCLFSGGVWSLVLLCTMSETKTFLKVKQHFFFFFWGCGVMLEKHPLAFEKAVICTFHFLQKSLKFPFMRNGPLLISGVRGLFKWMDCLEGTEVFLLPPVFLKPLDHPWTAEFVGIWWFFRTVVCINLFLCWLLWSNRPHWTSVCCCFRPQLSWVPKFPKWLQYQYCVCAFLASFKMTI